MALADSIYPTRLIVPPNIAIVALLPKPLELNPMENDRRLMRDNWLSNRIFTSYGDLLMHRCDLEPTVEDYVDQAP